MPLEEISITHENTTTMEDQNSEMDHLKEKISQMEKINASQSASHDSEVQVLSNSMEAIQETSTRMVAKLEEEVAAKDSIIAHVEDENARLKEDLEKVQKEFEMLNAVSDILPQKVEELTQELDSANSINEQNQSVIIDLQKKYTLLEQEKDEREKEYDHLYREKVKESENLRSINDALLVRIQEIQDENEAQKEEMSKKNIELETLKDIQQKESTARQTFENELNSKLEVQTEEADSLKEQILKLEGDIIQSKSDYESIEQSLQLSEDRYTDLEGKNKILVDAMDESKSELETYMISVETEKKLAEELKMDNESLTDMNEKLKQKVIELEEEQRPLTELNSTLNEKLETALKSVDELQNKILVLEEEKSSIVENQEDPTQTDDYRSLVEQHEALQNEKEGLLIKLNENKETLSATQEKLSLTSNDNLALIGNFSKLESEFKDMRESNDALMSKNDELTNLNKQLNDSLDTSNKALEESKNIHTYLEEKHVAFKKAYGSEVTMVKQNLKKAQSKNKDLEETIQALKKTNDTMEQEYLQMQEKIENLENTSTGENELNQTMKDNFDTLSTENEQLRCEINKLKEDLQNVSNDRDHQDENSRNQIESAQAKNEEIIANLKMELEKMNSTMEEEVASLTARYEQELERMREAETGSSTNDVDGNLSKVSVLEDEVFKLNETVETLSELENELNVEIERKDASISQYKKNISDLEELLNAKTTRCDELENALSEATGKHENEVHGKNENLSNFIEKENELQAINEELQAEVSILKEKLNSINEDRFALNDIESSERNTKLQDHIKQIEKDLMAKEKECVIYKSKYNDLVDKYEKSTKQDMRPKPQSIDDNEILQLKRRVVSLEDDLATTKNLGKKLSVTNSELREEIRTLKSMVSEQTSGTKSHLSEPRRFHRHSKKHKDVSPKHGNDNGSEMILPQKVDNVKKPLALIDFIDVVHSQNWKEINLLEIAENALKKYLGSGSDLSTQVIEESLELSFIKEFSGTKQYWYASLRIGKRVWDPSIPLEYDVPFSCGLAGKRLGRIVYDTEEDATDALLFFILRTVDPSGTWIEDILLDHEKSCLLKKHNSYRSIPWVALIRKGPRVYSADVKEENADKNIAMKSLLMGRSD